VPPFGGGEAGRLHTEPFDRGGSISGFSRRAAA